MGKRSGAETLVGLRLLGLSVQANEYHVSLRCSDRNKGTFVQPFKTISHAARLAVSGDIITVHARTYRELVVPCGGRTSAQQRITYRAAGGEVVIIKGSEIIHTGNRLSVVFGKSSCRTNISVDIIPH